MTGLVPISRTAAAPNCFKRFVQIVPCSSDNWNALIAPSLLSELSTASQTAQHTSLLWHYLARQPARALLSPNPWPMKADHRPCRSTVSKADQGEGEGRTRPSR